MSKVKCQKLFNCRLGNPCSVDCEEYQPFINVAEAMEEMNKDIRAYKERKETPGGSTPSQYALPDNATDLQDLIEFRNMNFAMGNIFKACYRQGSCTHSDALRDINKVLWFAEREKERLTNKLNNP